MWPRNDGQTVTKQTDESIQALANPMKKKHPQSIKKPCSIRPKGPGTVQPYASPLRSCPTKLTGTYSQYACVELWPYGPYPARMCIPAE